MWKVHIISTFFSESVVSHLSGASSFYSMITNSFLSDICLGLLLGFEDPFNIEVRNIVLVAYMSRIMLKVC